MVRPPIPPPTTITSMLLAALVSLRSGPHVFHGFEGGKLYTIELATHLFDFADVDIVDHVTSLAINRHRAARTFPSHALHCGHQGFAVSGRSEERRVGKA